MPKPQFKASKTTKPLDVTRSSAELTEASHDEASTIVGAGAKAEIPVNSNEIVGAIDSLRMDFGSRLDGLMNAIKGVQGDLNTLTTRLTEAEDRISTNEDEVVSLRTQNNDLKAAVNKLEVKVDDLENRARRSISAWLDYPNGQKQVICVVIWKSGSPKRLVHTTFPDQCLLKGHTESAGWIPRSGTLSLRHVPGWWKAFDAAKKILSSLSIQDLRYGIIHPATLLVTVKGRRHTFNTASAAEAFVRGLESEPQMAESSDVTPDSD
ncbi:hypothetical protein WMY93_012893 [Mugilogobius chulae]|uniref:Uncharacterized protein n=1 Tax=Mugilogobius chulae TaxID=88201 RepID=A0AAW0P8I2_9GOBI